MLYLNKGGVSMSFNALLLQSVAKELSQFLIGARVEKVHQPENSTITIELRLPGENHYLLLSTHPELGRIHLTDNRFENPLSPSGFCMLLRKHLEKYRFDSISAIPLERIVRLDFSREEDFGRTRNKKSLVLEIMGRHSNLILLDDNGIIIDSLNRIDETKSRVRQILPKLKYTLPPAQKKEDPKNITEEKLAWYLSLADLTQLPRVLVKNIAGLSPDLAHQLLAAVEDPKNATTLLKALHDLINLADQGLLVPKIDNDQLIFYPNGEGSVNAVLDRFYTNAFYSDKLKHGKQHLLSTLNVHLEKVEKKLSLRNDALEKALSAEEYRKKGDLLTASLYQLEKGANKAHVPDYYEEGQPLVVIELDPRLTPNENAQSYYKRYAKARSALKNLDTLLAETESEFNYLSEMKGLIEAAKDLADLAALHDELVKESWLAQKKIKSVTKQKSKDPTSGPRHYLSPSGIEIVVGRNNKQNDLIRRQSSGDYWWFHTQKIPGAHVILKSSNPEEDDLLTAANLAALFSRGSEDSLVIVDSARVKHVRKPTGAKPGFVLYDNERTYMIKPYLNLLDKLQTP